MLCISRPVKRSRPGISGMSGFEMIPVATISTGALTSPALVVTVHPPFDRSARVTCAFSSTGSSKRSAYRARYSQNTARGTNIGAERGNDIPGSAERCLPVWRVRLSYRFAQHHPT